MEPCPPYFAFACGLARDRESVRAALQKIEDWSCRDRQAASAARRTAGVAFPPNARSKSAQDGSGLFGNDRAGSARSDEGRRNDFPNRIHGPSGQAQRFSAEISAIALRAL